MEKRKRAQKAVALVYDDQKSSAPKVVASGKGHIADKIIEIARAAGVHIHEDRNLVELLANIPIGDEIPAELYQTVAEVLAFVYRINEKFRSQVQDSVR